MNTYEVQFWWHKKVYKEYITTTTTLNARQLISGKYQGAKIIYVRNRGIILRIALHTAKRYNSEMDLRGVTDHGKYLSKL